MVSVRFEHVSEESVSETYGPFEWVQLTYDMLRISPDGDVIAYFSHLDDMWTTTVDLQKFSDIVITGHTEISG